VTKYVTGPSFYKVSHPLLMNAKTWDKLPKHLRDVFMEALRLEVIEIDKIPRDLSKKNMSC
jgi:TRAP-type C4-dicarboxylate transport system substrate-binding protein